MSSRSDQAVKLNHFLLQFDLCCLLLLLGSDSRYIRSSLYRPSFYSYYDDRVRNLHGSADFIVWRLITRSFHTRHWLCGSQYFSANNSRRSRVSIRVCLQLDHFRADFWCQLRCRSCHRRLSYRNLVEMHLWHQLTHCIGFGHTGLCPASERAPWAPAAARGSRRQQCDDSWADTGSTIHDRLLRSIVVSLGYGAVTADTHMGWFHVRMDISSCARAIDVGAVLSMLWIIYELSMSTGRVALVFPRQQPMMPWELLSQRDNLLVFCINFIGGMAIFAVIYFANLYFTLVQGKSPSDAGLALLYYMPGVAGK